MTRVNLNYLSVAICFLVVLSACGSSSNSTSDTFTLAVILAGSGSGQITSTPAGINCGTDCMATYDSGTVVTLSAAPDNSNEFTTWFGDPDCMDGTVTLNSNVTCTASFNFLCDLLSQNCPGITDACYLNISSGSTTCAPPGITTPPGEQGDSCVFLNGCAAGYSCLLNDDPVSPIGFDCALSCDPVTPNTGCQAAGVGLTCVQINDFYTGANQITDEMGMCVDCTVYTCP